VKRFELLKKLLPGFVPLFIFIAADEIWGTRAGLALAMVTGLAELAILFIRCKIADF